MPGTILSIAILLLLYKALLYCMRCELNSLKEHNKKLRQSFEENESEKAQ